MLVLLPTTTIFEYLKLAVVLVLAFLCNVDDKGVIRFRYNSYVLIWVINIFLSVIFVFIVDRTINFGRVIHEIERVLFYALLIYCCKHYRVKRSLLSWICKILLIINLTIQLAQYFELFETYDFLRNNYIERGGKTTHLDLAYSGRSSFRSGAIFINPNVYMLFPIVFLIVFLYDSIKTKSIVPYLWMILSAVSIFLTGSRTGLVLFVAIYAVFIIINRKNMWKNLLILVVGLVGLYVIFSVLGGSFDSRIFDLNTEDSFGIKVQGLFGYLDMSNPVCWIFGSVSSNIAVHIDMEIGYIIAWFGIIGLYWYFSLIKDLGARATEGNKFFYRAIQILVLVNSVSSSAILNMSFFPFLCLMAFTTICEKEI